jgi:hypothetical protein
MNPENQPLFKKYPLTGKAVISTGEVPVPYHIYDGAGLFIGGVCDYTAARCLLQGEKVFPIRTVDDKAVMGIWVCDFTAASLGPHHELQFSFFVSRRRPDLHPQRAQRGALL